MSLAAALSVMVIAAAPTGAVHRFALFTGNNEGGDGTRPLLYSRDDARRLHEVFSRLGGIRAEDSMVLLDQSADDVTIALGELERRARDAKARGESTAFFFYYSGHAQDGSLRLGKTKLALEAIKGRLAQGPADVRVAVFDACRSGTLTRTKGVRRAPAFEVENDATRAAKGLVILTSSASDEDSQESDIIGASYFSYHLATGLIGSADQNNDGRVSLAEAYAYAYERTLASTADSASGPQHATFSFDLAGNGDLVLTDVIERREGLRVPAAAAAGVYFIIDPRGVVVAELVKSETERMIALPAGKYVVKRRLADRLRIGGFEIREGEVTTLNEPGFHDARFSEDPVKGTGVTTLAARHWSFSASGAYQAVFDRPTSSGGYFPSAPLLGAEAAMHNFFGRGFGLGIDVLFGWSAGTVNTQFQTNLAYRYSLVSFGAALFYEWNPEGRWLPIAGVHLAVNVMSRTFAGTTVPVQGFATMSPGIAAGLKYRVTRSFGAVARARVHYLLYNVDETRNLGYAELGLMLEYEFRD